MYTKKTFSPQEGKGEKVWFSVNEVIDTVMQDLMTRGVSWQEPCLNMDMVSRLIPYKAGLPTIPWWPRPCPSPLGLLTGS